MSVKLYESLFQETTNLKKAEITELLDIIKHYAESEELVYEIIGLINNDIKFSAIKNDLLAEKFGWAGCFYKKQRQDRHFKDSLLEKPPEVREGENECPKCHQKKTLVVEMQTRSADEGYTYYIHCYNPKCRAITR